MFRRRAVLSLWIFIAILYGPAAQADDWVFGDGFETLPISGNYAISVQSVNDPCGNRPFTGDPPPLITIAEIAPGQYRMSGASPWVTLTGSIASMAPGTAVLGGTGTVAGLAGVTANFGGIVHAGTLQGILTWGAANELPCTPSLPDESIKFTLAGSRISG